MAKHTLKISANTAIIFKYVGQVTSSDKNRTKKFSQLLHNDIVESWQGKKYSRKEKGQLEDRSRQNNMWRNNKLKNILGSSPPPPPPKKKKNVI